MKHKLEEKIPSPPQVLLSGCSPCKDLHNYPKYLISKQLPKKTQANFVLQENHEKNSSYACKSTYEQNEVSIETGLSDKNSELLRKLEQVKSLKNQTSSKKNTILYKKIRSLHNKDEESQREYFEVNINEQNESTLHDMVPHSSSYHDLQEEEKRIVHKVTPQSKGGFPKKSSSTMTNELSSTNTSCLITPDKQITMGYSSSSRDTMQCPNSPDTMFSKSSASLQTFNSERKSNCSLTLNSSDTEFSSLTANSIENSSGQSLYRELISIRTAITECKKEIRRVSSKLDISIMNQENLCHFINPEGKVIKRPSEMPPLPINTFEELDRMEKFLANDSNLTGACSYLGKNIDKKSIENSVRRILTKLVTNTLASKFSLQGHGNKKRFDALKLWDLVQGKITLLNYNQFCILIVCNSHFIIITLH
ncbi:PREDICTED: uncharacterized protein LOC105556849 [Vollenhovia emeryi]|uniref:uncharacterized protein LOC105556849 n=1 Tax=Vollenhovia emeryi TaxID=411798 RepID=UPI0005F50C65|nr:PREDICTED: uncharacterized protein LOC105556849 [Vollenhovia emeryi]